MEAIQGHIKHFTGDITSEVVQEISVAGVVAWDIETSGLDWQTDRIGTCQLYTPDSLIAIVKLEDKVPSYLRALISEPSVKKIFHHAMFDLRFMSHAWNVRPENIACTRIAAKLITPNDPKQHGLKQLLHHYLDVEISKDEQKSDWLSAQLTESQIMYAAQDVYYLPELLSHLERELDAAELFELARGCFAHIPTRVSLDVMNYPDLFVY